MPSPPCYVLRAMTERPILFSGPMVRALLEGRKTQTRRVVTWQPPEWVGEIATGRYHPTKTDRDGEEYPGSEIFGAYDDQGEWGCRCPWAPGDLLYVRETFVDGVVPKYRADYPDDQTEIIVGNNEHLPVWGVAWKPSIHMPKAAARIWLRVTDVRVERLQEITDEDAIAEGVTEFGGQFKGAYHAGDHMSGVSARECFARLWDSLNAKRGYGWDVNPWVWAITFSRATRTEEPEK